MEEQTSNAGQGLGIAALVLGIVALILAFIPCFGWIALIPGIIAIILAVVALSQASQARAPKGMIIAALVISILGTSVAAVVASHSNQWGREWFRSLDRATDEFEKEFESGYGKSLDEAVKEIDKELDKTLEELEMEMDSFLQDMEGLSDEEKAARVGRAAGKALKEFREELGDTVPVD
ncbi:MAG TPA: DUF4190 domain-containing protein [Bacteroidetes bacterium]|nr:DUF4190 domain-containing protein [Bacteroidota bacterium]